MIKICNEPVTDKSGWGVWRRLWQFQFDDRVSMC